MDEGLLQVQAMATRIACLRMTARHLKALHDSVDQASRLPVATGPVGMTIAGMQSLTGKTTHPH
jgi:hypothetical protein